MHWLWLQGSRTCPRHTGRCMLPSSGKLWTQRCLQRKPPTHTTTNKHEVTTHCRPHQHEVTTHCRPHQHEVTTHCRPHQHENAHRCHGQDGPPVSLSSSKAQPLESQSEHSLTAPCGNRVQEKHTTWGGGRGQEEQRVHSHTHLLDRACSCQRPPSCSCPPCSWCTTRRLRD
jgi:hypothetical protein